MRIKISECAYRVKDRVSAVVGWGFGPRIRYTAPLFIVRANHMSHAEPDTVEVITGENPVGSVVWLHGLGADGHDFEPVVAELALPAALPLRFVFPHAPVRPVTINGGMPMRAWYDIVSLDGEGRADRKGVEDSSVMLDRLVDRELERGSKPEDIVIAGFSQGGAIALYYLLQTRHRLRGLIALSAYLPVQPAADASAASGDGSADTALPIFMAHGTMDPMVPYRGGRQSKDALERLGYRVEWHEYPMAHAVCPQEIRDIRTWLLTTFGISGSPGS